jgi:hypothetical protein
LNVTPGSSLKVLVLVDMGLTKVNQEMAFSRF